MGANLLEFVIPAAVRPDAVVRALESALTVAARESEELDRVVLESFDGRLLAAGLTLEHAVAARAGTSLALTLREPGRLDEQVTVKPPRRDRILATELPAGRVRDVLEPLLEERAALPVARVASRIETLAVLNSDAKTVVRVRLEEPELLREDGERVRLDSRLSVSAVRGYDKPFERVCKVLGSDIGLAEAGRTLADEALQLSGAPVAPPKLKVELAPGMRTDSSAQSVCRTLAIHVEANLPGTLADLDPEFLHDLRVAIRRSRSVLRELKGAFPPADYKQARQDLRWIQAVTGQVRDLDVALLDWDGLVAPLAPAVRADLAPLHALLSEHRAAALARMRTELVSERYGEAWARWRDLLDRDLRTAPAGDERPDAARAIAAVAGERIRSVYGRMRDEGKAIKKSSPPEALHDLRKRGKELRYLLELFGGLWGGDSAKPLIAALKQLQDTLGRYQDRHIQADFLRSLGPELAQGPGGPDALIALGLVIDRLTSDGEAARREFDERFAAFSSKSTRAVVATAFGRGR